MDMGRPIFSHFFNSIYPGNNVLYITKCKVYFTCERHRTWMPTSIINVTDDYMQTPKSLVIVFAFLYFLALVFGLLVH
jgi:hypothetical protein